MEIFNTISGTQFYERIDDPELLTKARMGDALLL